MNGLHELTAFQRRLKDDIERAARHLFGRRRVNGVEGARVRTVGFDPQDNSDRPLRWLRPDVQIGDEVLTVQQGGDEIVIGALRKHSDAGTVTHLHIDGTWDGEHLQMGSHHLWIDSSGRLRIKNGAPTSTTDGSVVGSQS